MEIRALRSKLGKQRNVIGRLEREIEALKDDKKLLVHDLAIARKNGKHDAMNLVLLAITNGATLEQLRQYVMQERNE